MKRHTSLLPFLLAVSSVPLLTSCTSVPRKPPGPSLSAAVRNNKLDAKPAKAKEDDLDEYSTASVADPFEPLNRAIFWLNDGVYTVALRPISKGYEKVLPKPVRQGIDNAFENVKFPVRLINNALQGNFKRAWLETERFFVNTVIGFGGIVRQSDRFPSLADVPAADTGQTFAKWGIGHGAYIVLPLLGPSSLRDTVGLAGDYALNPVNLATTLYGGYAWTIAIPSTNTLRAMPDELAKYDSATKNALDRYLAARSSYIQYRHKAALK
ncbi:MAG TPA: VacJ family lipoprotein [Terrimicrobiaceae bacterium]